MTTDLRSAFECVWCGLDFVARASETARIRFDDELLSQSPAFPRRPLCVQCAEHLGGSWQSQLALSKVLRSG
jgi:hypothetical protein